MTKTVAADCSYNNEYLNDTMSNTEDWKCVECPPGAVCSAHSRWNEVITREGYWRVPWSNTTFVRCPFFGDCIGVNDDYEKPDLIEIDMNSTNITNILDLEKCLEGTKGPMCSLCKEGWNRDTTMCTPCTNAAFGIRVVIFIIGFVILMILLKMCKKRMESKWKKYEPLWMDVLTILSINVTFAQVNSSLPSVIEVPWPVQWQEFVRSFNFVNIDLFALLGVSCIGDFNFFISFLIMMCIPIGILLIAIFNYHYSHTMMKTRLNNLTVTEKLIKEREALHQLYDLADVDHSGHVDPKELSHILHQLGWEMDQASALEVAISIGGVRDQSDGSVRVPENIFIETMLSGDMNKALLELEIKKKEEKAAGKKKRRKSILLKSSEGIHRTRSVQGYVKDYTADREQLVLWTLRAQIISSSLAGSTQLLLLAHTPVSRKVFQYFHCLDIAGQSLLHADYNISCKSSEYFGFLPIVLATLFGYTVLLPAIILFYLHRHRHELYSTHVIQRIGWLYTRFVRGAEFWQVHDVLMKMVLTGMLIYIPPTLRAGVGALICVVACNDLNFFRPHKSHAPFWLSQMSWIVTTAKYITALLLNSDTDKAESEKIGFFLIGVDLTFLLTSVLSLFVAAWILRHKIKMLERRITLRERAILDVQQGTELETKTKTTTKSNGKFKSTQVLPIENVTRRTAAEEEEAVSVRNWGEEGREEIEIQEEKKVPPGGIVCSTRQELNGIKQKYGTRSEEYKMALEQLGKHRKKTMTIAN